VIRALWKRRPPDAKTLAVGVRVVALSRPFTLPLGVAAVIVGCLALWYGAAVSAALSVILPESVAPANTEGP